METKTIFKKAIFIIVLLFFVSIIDAQTNTYTGATGGSWNTGTNWSLGVPTVDHDVIIPEGLGVTVNTAAVCNSLTMQTGNSSHTITIASPNSLTVTNAINIEAPTNGNRNKTIAVTTGTLTCGSITMAITGNDTRICRVTVTTGTINVTGNITMNGTSVRNYINLIGTAGTGGTLNIGGAITGGDILPTNNNSIVNFNGTSPQIMPINADYVYNNVRFNNASGVTLAAGITSTVVTNDISLESGILNNGGFAITGSGSNTFSVSDGATLQLEGTSVFPTGFATTTLATTSTVEYKGTGVQTVFDMPAPGYGNLTFDGVGGSWTIASDIDIANLLTVNNGDVVMSNAFNIAGNGPLTVASGGTLTLNNTACITQTGYSGANSGDIVVNKDTTPIIALDYTYWSSPTSGSQTLSNFSPLTSSSRFYTYHNGWTYSNPASSTFSPGIGYAIRNPEGISATVPSISSHQFTGVPNNGTYNLGVTFDPSQVEFLSTRLIGNPYPSALDADAFITANVNGTGTINQTISGTLYFWTHNHTLTGSDYLASDYATYTLLGGTAVATGTGNTSTPNGNIASGQGFVVHMLSSGNVTFNNSMRLGTNNSNFYRTSNGIPKSRNLLNPHRLWINLTNSTSSFSQILIGHTNVTTSQIDPGYDGLYYGNDKHVLYSIIDNGKYSINARPSFDVADTISIGFRTNVAGSNTLTLDHVDGMFLSGQKIYINDSYTKMIHCLSDSPYTFNSESGEFNDRFVLQYVDYALSNKGFSTIENVVSIIYNNDKINIKSNGENIDKIEVYDLIGRKFIQKNNLNINEYNISTELNSQVGLIKVYLADGKVITKKILF